MRPHAPSFERLFRREEQGALYLALLGMDDGAKEAVEAIRAAMAASPNPSGEVLALLANPDWREQLAAALALLLGPLQQEWLDALWSAIDRGSWTSPQLAAVASLVDAGFSSKAKERIEARCPIDPAGVGTLPWTVRHSAAGPGSIVEHSAKMYSALSALVEKAGENPAWLEVSLSTPEVQALLLKDVDKGGVIARGWLERLKGVLPLPARAQGKEGT